MALHSSPILKDLAEEFEENYGHLKYVHITCVVCVYVYIYALQIQGTICKEISNKISCRPTVCFQRQFAWKRYHLLLNRFTYENSYCIKQSVGMFYHLVFLVGDFDLKEVLKSTYFFS